MVRDAFFRLPEPVVSLFEPVPEFDFGSVAVTGALLLLPAGIPC